jgi:predicted amidohydrolase YtcJ
MIVDVHGSIDLSIETYHPIAETLVIKEGFIASLGDNNVANRLFDMNERLNVIT